MMQRESLSLKAKLVVAQMALMGLKLSTISFYMHNAVLLEQDCGVTLKEMTTYYPFSMAGASRHLRSLRENGIVEKCSYRNWRLSNNPVCDYDFLQVLKLERVLRQNDHAAAFSLS